MGYWHDVEMMKLHDKIVNIVPLKYRIIIIIILIVLLFIAEYIKQIHHNKNK